jgi:hypothetical protein
MISHISNEKEPKLFRANLVQTGILFHGTLDVSVRYFTGPFYHSTCRIDDAKDFEKSTVYVDKN